MRPGVSAVRFATEVAALAALAVAGLAIAWPLALALPAAFAFVWGWWVAPKARSRLADPSRLAVEIVLFVAAGHLEAGRHVDAMGDDHVVGAHADVTGEAVGVEVLEHAEQPGLEGLHVGDPQLPRGHPLQCGGAGLVLADHAAGHEPAALGRAVVAQAEQNLGAAAHQHQVDGHQRRVADDLEVAFALDHWAEP